MKEYDVCTPEDAFVYLLDCTLATVATMMMKKKPPVGEYRRQIAMAQMGINWCKEMNLEVTTTRAKNIILNYKSNVSLYCTTRRADSDLPLILI